MEVEDAPGHWLDDEGAVGSLVGQPECHPFASYLRPGDAVEAETEKLGILRNPVISWRDAHGTDAPAADSWI